MSSSSRLRTTSASHGSTPSRRRWTTGVALGATAAIALSSCSFVSEDAARMGDKQLSNGDFYSLLDGYAKATQSGFLPSGNIDAEIARVILLDWIGTSVLEKTLLEYGVEITQSDLDAATESLTDQVGFADAPEAVRTFYTRATAVRTVTGETFSPDAEELAELYASGPKESGVACLRLILTDSREDADAAIARMAAGETFADVALTASTDTSADIGGILENNQTGDECFPFDEIVERIVGPIADAIPTARPGVVNGPIEVTDLGWVILQLRPYSEVADEAARIIGPVTATRLTNSALDNASIWVNPEFGTWDRESRRVVAADQ